MPTTTTAHPVDSTYHPCCNAIGQHANACTITADVAPPAGASEVGEWRDSPGAPWRYRTFTTAIVGGLDESTGWLALHLGGLQFVGDTTGEQHTTRMVGLHVNGRAVAHLLPGQARKLAAGLAAAADDLELLADDDGRPDLAAIPTDAILGELRGRGLSDADIAAELGVDVEQVSALSGAAR